MKKKVILLNTKLLIMLNKVLDTSVETVRLRSNIKSATWYNLMRNPNSLTMKQLIDISNGLHIPVHRFFSVSDTLYIGNLDHYVQEPYTECYYDGEKLYEQLRDRGVTWQDVADALDGTRARIRNAVLGVTRLEVNRFLVLCRHYSIDPFSVLIDNNIPYGRKAHMTYSVSKTSSTLADYTTLKQELDNLRNEIERFKEEFRHLKQVNEALRQSLAKFTGG